MGWDQLDLRCTEEERQHWEQRKRRWRARPIDVIRNDRTGKTHLAFPSEDFTLCRRTRDEDGMTQFKDVPLGNAEVQATCHICRRKIPGPPWHGTNAEVAELTRHIRQRNEQRKRRQRTKGSA